MNVNLTQYYHSGTRLFWHAAFWIVLLLYHSIIYSMHSGNFGTELFWEGVALPVKMGATYATLYFLLPQYFMTRQFIRFIVYVGIGLLLAALLQRGMEYAIINWFIDPAEQVEVLLNPVKVLRAVIGIYPVVALAAFIKIGKLWYERDLESGKLEKEKLESELKFLRAQIHPHFLFNTLNNLYALTLKKSDQAPQVVVKLSDLLSYMLYDGNRRLVPLDKEMEVLETYLSLQQLRYGKRLNVSFQVNGDTSGKEIPPLLLLPFIENSFKHGAEGHLADSRIDIKIDVQKNQFQMRVNNTVDKTEAKTENQNGIGLSNVRRRLELLFGMHYKLDIIDENKHFEVKLEIDLDHITQLQIP